MQSQRFEKKYWIDEGKASSVRNYLRSYMLPDEHDGMGDRHTYPVRSIYLDSDDLATYWMSLNGDRNRYKLRLRFYHADPEAPVFCEIKRRSNKCIHKQRAAVRQETVSWLMEGNMPGLDHLLARSPRQHVALQHFMEMVTLLQARPKLIISYQREAWVCPTNPGLRVTLDQKVEAEPLSQARFDGVLKEPRNLLGDKIVLELKFADRFPNWLREMVETFNLVQGDSPKYCLAIDAVGLKPAAGARPRDRRDEL